ncbi:hypothetical protein GQ55_3G162500 [Panicum hallii var. hallii]|uniref:Uncharacterized protein n=1 Tax=Panicum hallii var. hallii TaxID=1504633 RepID=A0A2T7EA52_9POAL|nr:hypothetical protein GQ55_3G162500 [Panicum hallii var. hallii]
MAGSPPRKCDDDGIMDFIPRHDLVKPIPRSMARFVCDYDIVRIGKMLSAPDGDRSFAEKWEYIKNNLESYRKPNAHSSIHNENDDEDDDDEMDEDDELEVSAGDEKKRSIDVELQVPNEGERKCKNPRLAESLSAGQKKKLRMEK